MKWLMLIALCFYGCGPQADSRKVDSSRFGFSNLNFIFPDKEIDPEIRSLTLLNFPLEKDVVGFSYTPLEPDWTTVFSAIDYGDKVPYGISNNISSFQKTALMIYFVLVSGDVRNFSYETIHQLKIQRSKLNAELKEIFDQFPCFAGQRPNHRRCYLAQNDLSEDEPSYAATCSALERRQWIDPTPEEEQHFQDSIALCHERDGGKLAEIETKINFEDDIREKAKGIVLDLLAQAERHAKSLFVATGATKGEIDSVNGNQSFIQMNEDRTGFTQFQLAIDFNIGKGYEVFNLENGKIRDLTYTEIAPGILELRFKLYNDIYWFEAELSTDINDVYDLRFSGDIYSHFNDGTIRKGVMKIEMDFKESL